MNLKRKIFHNKNKNILPIEFIVNANKKLERMQKMIAKTLSL